VTDTSRVLLPTPEDQTPKFDEALAEMIGASSKTKKEAEAARIEAQADTGHEDPKDLTRFSDRPQRRAPKQSFGREKPAVLAEVSPAVQLDDLATLGGNWRVGTWRWRIGRRRSQW
jgi:hypothetical protein